MQDYVIFGAIYVGIRQSYMRTPQILIIGYLGLYSMDRDASLITKSLFLFFHF